MGYQVMRTDTLLPREKCPAVLIVRCSVLQAILPHPERPVVGEDQEFQHWKGTSENLLHPGRGWLWIRVEDHLRSIYYCLAKESQISTPMERR